jgi:hypothetical protein
LDQFDASSDGKRVAYVSRDGPRLKILDLADPAKRRSFNTMPSAAMITVTPNGRWAAVNSWHAAGGEIWDLDAGAIVARPAFPAYARPYFSVDGRRLIVARSDGVAVIRTGEWDEMRRAMLLLSTAGVCTSYDGRLLVGFDERGAVHFLDLERLEEIVSFSPPEPTGVIASAFSADGATLAVFTFRGVCLQIWNLRRIRAALAPMGLDWEATPLPPEARRGADRPLMLEVELGPPPTQIEGSTAVHP